MTWIVPKDLAYSSWEQMKNSGVEQIISGECHFDLSEWRFLGSQHLAVVVFWWKIGKKFKKRLHITGADSVFTTLASLSGVNFILAEC